MNTQAQDRVPYRPLVDACRARGIGRTTAFELKARGLIDCFNIGRRTFVYLDSLNSLGERLGEAHRASTARIDRKCD